MEKELRWRSSIREIQELVGRALETARHREPSAETLLGETHRALSKAAELDETLAGPLENVSEILTRFQETIHEVEAHLQTLEPDDQRLAELEARHDLLWKLKKKYGGSLVRVLEMQQEARQKLDEIGQAESNDTTYEKAHRELLREVNQAGQELRQARQAARERLAAAVRKNLAGLRLDDARFDVTLTPYLSKIETDEDLEKAAIFGLEEVEFRFSANPGAPLQPLRKTASGGELARCALAIKSALAGEDRVPTVVFDEVDSSIGGRLAPVLGEKLTALSASLQVILVTHLPGLARIADVHLKVQKRVEKGVTNIQIQRLDGKERERELREMEGQSGSSKS